MKKLLWADQDLWERLRSRAVMSQGVRGRLHWAGRSDVPLSVLVKLCDDTNDEVAQTAARNRLHTEESLTGLARHSNMQVRLEVARRSDVTVDLLNILLQDSEASVREEARSRLPSALLLAAPTVVEHNWDESEGFKLLLGPPAQQTEQVRGTQGVTSLSFESSVSLHTGVNHDAKVSTPVAISVSPLRPAEEKRVMAEEALRQPIVLPVQENPSLTEFSLTYPSHPLSDTPVTPLEPAGYMEALYELTDEKVPVDQTTLLERFAEQHGLVLDAPLEERLLRTLTQLSAARRISRIIARPDAASFRKSDILIERRSGRTLPPAPTLSVERPPGASRPATSQNPPREDHPTKPAFQPRTQPEPKRAVSPQPVVKPMPTFPKREMPFLQPTQKDKPQGPESTPPEVQGLAAITLPLVILPKVESASSPTAEDLASLLVVTNTDVTAQNTPRGVQPDSEVDANFLWSMPDEGDQAEADRVQEFLPAMLFLPSAPAPSTKPSLTTDIDIEPDSFGLLLPFIPDQREFSADEVAGRTLRERAEQLAAELVHGYQLELEDIDSLADVLEVTGVGQVKQAVERLLQRGASMEEVRLCHELKCLWLECPDYNTTWSYRRGSGWSTHQFYDNLSWPLALRFIRGFNNLPHIDEVHHVLAHHFERWSRIREYGSHYSFVSYLMTLTEGFEHPFDWDYFSHHEPTAR